MYVNCISRTFFISHKDLTSIIREVRILKGHNKIVEGFRQLAVFFNINIAMLHLAIRLYII